MLSQSKQAFYLFWSPLENRVAILAIIITGAGLWWLSALPFTYSAGLTLFIGAGAYVGTVVAQFLVHFSLKMLELVDHLNDRANETEIVLKNLNELLEHTDQLIVDSNVAVKNVSDQIDPLTKQISTTLDTANKTTEKVLQLGEQVEQEHLPTLKNILSSVSDTADQVSSSIQSTNETFSTFATPVTASARCARWMGSWFCRSNDANTNEKQTTQQTSEGTTQGQSIESKSPTSADKPCGTNKKTKKPN